MINIKDKLVEFYDKEISAAIGYMLCACIAQDNFDKEIEKYLNKFNKYSDANELKNTFEEINKEIIILVDKFKAESDFRSKYDIMIYIRGFFSLLEGAVENSNLTKNVINKLKNAYGENYIDQISAFDRAYLSKDGKEFLSDIKEQMKKDSFIDEYLVLKEYQDITHYLYLSLINDIFKEFTSSITNGLQFKNAFMKEQFIKNNYIELKLKEKIRSIDEVAQFVTYGFDENVKNVLGGKAYGLAVLKLLGQDVPNAYCIPIDYSLENINLDIFNEDKKYSVRSSANVEDGTEFSFAGMFNSYLDVPKSDIVNKVILVLNSAENKRALDYIEKFNLNNPKMAVVVQEFVEPTFSGIWIGTQIDSGILEYHDGCGDQIVSGRVVPKREIWNQNTDVKKMFTINEIVVGQKLLGLQKVIVNKFGFLPDFEWCIVNNQIKMVQFRSATTKIEIDNTTNQEVLLSDIIGVPCSSGEYEGFAQLIRNVEQLNDLQPQNILLSVFTDPDWVIGMNKAGAIVTAMGGFLCHAAIISRELKIPCVTGIGIQGLQKIKDKKIKINGNTGIIKILD